MMFQSPAKRATVVTAVNTSDMFTNALHVFIPSLKVINGPAEE